MADAKVIDANVASIMSRMALVMADIETVKKNGRNKFHGYEYATESDLLAKVRPSMAKHGLILLPSQKNVSPPDAFGNVTVCMEYTLASVDGAVWPEKLIAYGVGNDRAKNGNDGDKAVYKAVTGANKYLLFKLFQVSTGDDPEDETVSPEERPRAPAASPSAIDKVIDFANRVADMLDQGARPAEVYQFEESNKERFERLRGEFKNVPAVKAIIERIDKIYAEMA